MKSTSRLSGKLRSYWTLIKSLQTGLLLITGLAGYMSARCPVIHWTTLLAVTGSLFLAISGSTILNMVYDRDIDGKMLRTCQRPLPSGQVSPREALRLGLALSVAGVGWAVLLLPLYGLVVFAGWFFDIVVYTVWLKRRTPYSIVIGGLSGGMPALAGRVLAVGQVDAVGILLTLAVLLWIPTHIMTFSIRHEEDYASAGVPTFPSVYGVAVTRTIIALSSLAAGVAMVAAAVLIGMDWGYLRLLAVLSLGLLGLAFGSLARPSERMNFGLFKYASSYMLGAMLLVIVGGL
ncbi:MAG: protoheme IX farnesyltransferase [Thermoflexales bacterium]|nr:protoheme IX farnesyltransferase [Thermoflexales bacterium]